MEPDCSMPAFSSGESSTQRLSCTMTLVAHDLIRVGGHLVAPVLSL